MTARAPRRSWAMWPSRATASSMSARGRRARRASTDRRQRQGGVARLHQHAVLGDGVAAGRRPRAKRSAPGRDPGSDGRGRLHGPAHAEDEAACRAAADRHPLQDRLDDARRNISRSSRSRASRPTSPPSSAPTTVRVHELGEENVAAHPCAACAHAGAGEAGDGGRRRGRRLVADLFARHLRQDAGTDRADASRRRRAAACTSRTCATRAIMCSMRWMS